MLRTNFFIPTLRENPKEAEVISHKLLLRSGCIRQVASGIYSILPLGKRVLEKINAIVREEMNAIGANEVIFPLTKPAELCLSSGRWNFYGKELFRLKDRFERDFALAPTHEEVCTAIVANEIHSYKHLPLILYQIHWKLRDEVRPRYGLLRAREFLMKDAYSFHSSLEDLDNTYQSIYEAYSTIFSRLSFDYIAVEADTGSIGGSVSHEFMVVTDVGEDTIVRCSSCGYTANLEKAQSQISQTHKETKTLTLTLIHTPNVKTIEELSSFCSVDSSAIIKSIAYIVDRKKAVLVCIRADRTVNETKLKNYLNAHVLEYATEEVIKDVFHSFPGSLGPKNLPYTVDCIVDAEIEEDLPYIVGANTCDEHYSNFVMNRDMERLYTKIDIRTVEKGDCCYLCSSPLVFYRGIEVGHIFKLGTKYSDAMQAYFLNTQGTLEPFIMGCYGIGISRILSAIVEQSHDEKGIVFPLSVAPFSCTLLTLDNSDEIVELGDTLYHSLSDYCEVLYDDRNERAGVKLHDADLIGIPLQIIIGKKGIERGTVECKIRKNEERFEIPIKDFDRIFVKEIGKHYPEFLKYCTL